MKAFITGGAGFIGGYIAARLLEQGQSVTIFDKKEPHSNLLNNRNLFFIQDDLLNLTSIARSIVEHDIVYHLAANADISTGVSDTALDLQLTTIATYNVLEAMRLSSIKDIVFLSGSGVYGDTEGKIVSESTGPLLPVSLYGASKLAAEGLISAFSNMFDLRATIFRPANIVGGGQTHGVLFDFIHKLKRDPSKLQILGDGHQLKSYLHVSDLYEALKIVVNAGREGLTLLNIASDDLVDVNWIAEEVINGLSLSPVEISYSGGRVGWVGDVPRIHMNTEMIKRYGWQPRFSSKQAVRQAILELRERH